MSFCTFFHGIMHIKTSWFLYKKWILSYMYYSVNCFPCCECPKYRDTPFPGSCFFPNFRKFSFCRKLGEKKKKKPDNKCPYNIYVDSPNIILLHLLNSPLFKHIFKRFSNVSLFSKLPMTWCLAWNSSTCIS